MTLMHQVHGGVLIADFQMSRMIELQSRQPYCRLHTDRGDIQRMILASDSKRMRLVPRDSVQALENVCNEADNVSTEIEGGLGFIYPGTKWCGPGEANFILNLYFIKKRHSIFLNYFKVIQCLSKA